MENKTTITIEDEFGTHEFTSKSDCIVIIDDGNGNITFQEEECEEEDTLSRCDDCMECVREGYPYCIWEEGDF